MLCSCDNRFAMQSLAALTALANSLATKKGNIDTFGMHAYLWREIRSPATGTYAPIVEGDGVIDSEGSLLVVVESARGVLRVLADNGSAYRATATVFDYYIPRSEVDGYRRISLQTTRRVR